MEETIFPNWQSRLFLKNAAKQQPIAEAKIPGLARSLLRWYEQTVLGVDLSGIRIDRPIFLIGVPRSGTTMVQDLLCAHPHLAFFTNTMNRFPRDFCGIEAIRKRLRLDFRGERYLRDSVQVSAGSPSDALNFWGHWFGLDPFSLEYHPVETKKFTPDQIAEIMDSLRRAIWSFGEPDRRFFCKLLAPLPHLEAVNDLFPDACYLHIVRDGRMTANSMLKTCRREIEQQERFHTYRLDSEKNKQYFIPYPRFPRLTDYVRQYGIEDIRTTAHLWDDAISYIDSVKGSLKHFREVRFEDLLDDPQTQVHRILEFCRLDPPHESADAFWDKFREIGVIHHTNRYADLEIAQEICADNLRKHGYLG